MAALRSEVIVAVNGTEYVPEFIENCGVRTAQSRQLGCWDVSRDRYFVVDTLTFSNGHLIAQCSVFRTVRG